MTNNYLTGPRPRLFGHRGSAATHPENTLPAFAAALEAGVPYLELDVHATADGEVVVLHDDTLLRTCGVDRAVSHLALRELKQYDAGFTFTPDGGGSFPFRERGITVPTLAEVLEAFPQALFNIEIKQEAPGIEGRTLDILAATGRSESVLLAAEQDLIMARLRPLCGAIPTSFCFQELVAFFTWLGTQDPPDYRPPARVLQIPEVWQGRTLVTEEMLAATRHLGLEVHVWTVNAAADMRRLLTMGVDGLMSDDPALLVRMAAQSGPDENKP